MEGRPVDVRCERCKATYRFDEAQVPAEGLTVRCTTCGHVFLVRKKVLAVTVPVRAGEGARPPVPASSVEAPRPGDAPRQVAPTRPYGPTHPASARPPTPGPAVGPGGTAFYTPPTFPAEPAPSAPQPAAGRPAPQPFGPGSGDPSGRSAPAGAPAPLARARAGAGGAVPDMAGGVAPGPGAVPGTAGARTARPGEELRLTVELGPEEVAQVRRRQRLRTRLLVVALLVVTVGALAYVFWPGV